MKKAALSLAVIAASGAYVWLQPAADTGDLLLGADSVDSLQTGGIQPLTLPASGDTAPEAPQAAPLLTSEGPAPISPPQAEVPPLPPPKLGTLPQLPAADRPRAFAASGPAPVAPRAPATPPAISTVANVPVPRPRPAYFRPPALSAPKPIRVASAGAYADGTYIGPVVNAYYGLMQIEAIVHNGRLTAIRVLQYPNDRRTSIYINRQALPMLRDEVVSAQTANVDIISGATLSSEAFLRSLDGALRKARSL